VAEHRQALTDVGVDVVLVRRPADLAKLAGIVLPGGESTTMSMLLDSSGLFGPLGDALASGLPAFGTCAGLILVARTVVDGRPGQRTFGCIDLVVRRNGYGRQAQSFECDLSVSGLDDGDPGETGIGEHRPDGRIVTGGEVADRAMHAVFIRAPVVESVGPAVEVLAWVGAPEPAGRAGAVGLDSGGDGPGEFPGVRTTAAVCRQGSVLVSAFHPELTGDRRLHRLFVAMAERFTAGATGGVLAGETSGVTAGPGRPAREDPTGPVPVTTGAGNH